MKKTFIILGTALILSSAAAQKTYSFDKNHARLGFSASHFGVSNVEGTFRILEATLKSAKDDFTDAVIEMKADAKGIMLMFDMKYIKPIMVYGDQEKVQPHPEQDGQYFEYKPPHRLQGLRSSGA